MPLSTIFQLHRKNRNIFYLFTSSKFFCYVHTARLSIHLWFITSNCLYDIWGEKNFFYTQVCTSMYYLSFCTFALPLCLFICWFNIYILSLLYLLIWVISVLQLPVPSVFITYKVVSSNPTRGDVYLIQHYVINFVSDLWQIGGLLRFPWPVTLTTTI